MVRLSTVMEHTLFPSPKQTSSRPSPSLIDRYAARLDSLKNLCLVEFAAKYTIRSVDDREDGDKNGALPPAEDQQESLS